MGDKREQLETLNMSGQKLTREEGLSNTDKDNIHKDLALINERFKRVREKITLHLFIYRFYQLKLFKSSLQQD